MAEYRTPKPTADCIIRANPPIGWALPKDLCFDHGPLLSDDLASKRTGQRRKQ